MFVTHGKFDVFMEDEMPYKLRGNTVMVKRGDKWVSLKKHKTKKEAMAHMRALYANVKDAK